MSDVFGASPERIQAFSSRVDPPDSSQPQANAARSPSSLGQHSSPKKAAPPKQSALVPAVQDSGYFGSQDVAPVEILIDPILKDSEQAQLLPGAGQVTAIESLSNRPPHAVSAELVVESLQVDRTGEMAAVEEKPAETDQASGSRTLPKEQYRGDANFEAQPSVTDHPDNNPADMEQEVQTSHAKQASEDPRSPSDGSSPIWPMVRKSSLNFASLPAREPFTAGKSIGGRTSRTSHLDHVRTSYYNIPTGGKSLSSLVKTDLGGNGESDEMDIDGNVQATNDGQQNSVAVSHTRTYTQRLQDQINLLGKSQSGQSKLVSGAQPPKTTAPASPMPMRKPASQNTPGAFPNDDDDWIEPPAIASATSGARPALPKSHSIDVMEEIQGKDTIWHEEFGMSDHGNDGRKDGRSEHASVVQERADHVCELPLLPAQATLDPELQSLRNVVSGPDPSLRTVSGLSMDTPSKSPSRTFRDSPLKQVKNKLSSILKSSKGLLASSAAISAEGKSSVLSPSTACPGLYTTTSSESVASRPTVASRDMQEQAEYADGSPGRPVARRTRASIEREKEERRRDKEAKRMEAQNKKLEKAREKEREKALVFSREQERIAAMEKKLSSKNAAQNPMPKQTPKPIRSSPRKFKAAEDAQKVTEDDIETEDALASAPPPSAARSIRPNQFARGKETKRPVRPAKETKAKTKQAPTVIRVNTGSQSQYHSAGRLSTASHDPSGPASLQSQTRLVSKSSKALHAKPSTQGLRAPSSVSRPKTLDLMAKKELEEREAQRRRDIKTEMERKRAAAQEDQRKHEQWRRQEAERQRQQDHQHATSQNEGKVPTQKRAALEKGKQTKPLPPAARSQASGTAATAGTQEKSTSTASSVSGEARPQSWATSTLHRSQDETSRPVNAVLSNTSKAGTKRALGPERSDEQLAKRAPSRGGPAYQANEAKRRRTSDAFDDDAEPDQLRNIKGPLVRPSGGYKVSRLVCRALGQRLMSVAGCATQAHVRVRKCISQRDAGPVQGDGDCAAQQPSQGDASPGHGADLQGADPLCTKHKRPWVCV